MIGLGYLIRQRIREQVAGFTTVELGSLILPLLVGGPIDALLPACAITAGPGDFEDQPRPNAVGIETQTWDIAILVSNNASIEEDGLAEVKAGHLMLSVFKALHGFKAGNGAQRQGMVYRGRYDPIFNLGWALFPMQFEVKTVIGDEHG